MKNVLLTGASGFLGKTLLSRLGNNSEYFLYAQTSNPRRLEEHIRQYNNIKVLDNQTFPTDEPVDYIIHCAFPRQMKDEDFLNALDYSINVFNFAREKQIKGIIHVSSQSLYSKNRTHAARENDSLEISDGYCVGKICFEVILDRFYKDIPHTNLRLASLIGPDFDQRIVNRFIDQALRCQKIKVVPGKQAYSFLDVEDAVNSLILLLNSNPSNWNLIYNIGSNEKYDLNTIAHSVKDVIYDSTGKEIVVEVLEGDKVDANFTIDSKLFTQSFGSFQEINLRKSIERILENKLLKDSTSETYT